MKYGSLDFYYGPDKSSKAIYKQVSITENNGLPIKQISACAGDNASINYGQYNLVFPKRKENNPHIMKADCKCQIINNTVKTANHILPYKECDVEAFVRA